MGILEKIGLTRLVISEDEILLLLKRVINRPILTDATPETKSGVSIALASVVEHLREKEILTVDTVKRANEILSEWLNA